MEYMIKPVTHGLGVLLGIQVECATDPEVQKDHVDHVDQEAQETREAHEE
jgi:hypothetical protein